MLFEGKGIWAARPLDLPPLSPLVSLPATDTIADNYVENKDHENAIRPY